MCPHTSHGYRFSFLDGLAGAAKVFVSEPPGTPFAPPLPDPDPEGPASDDDGSGSAGIEGIGGGG